MKTIGRIIRKYISKDGKNHFRGWLNNLKDIKAKVKIDIRIARLRLATSVMPKVLETESMNCASTSARATEFITGWMAIKLSCCFAAVIKVPRRKTLKKHRPFGTNTGRI